MRSEVEVPIGYVSHKSGVRFDEILASGFVLLSAITMAAETLRIHLIVSSATDGVHSGPTDPHKRGEAYDLSIAAFTVGEVNEIIQELKEWLRDDEFTILYESPTPIAGSDHPVTINPGASAPHLHLQVKKGTTYPPASRIEVVTT